MAHSGRGVRRGGCIGRDIVDGGSLIQPRGVQLSRALVIGNCRLVTSFWLPNYKSNRN